MFLQTKSSISEFYASHRGVWWCSPPAPSPCWTSRWTSERLWRTHWPGMRAVVWGKTCTPCRFADKYSLVRQMCACVFFLIPLWLTFSFSTPNAHSFSVVSLWTLVYRNKPASLCKLFSRSLARCMMEKGRGLTTADSHKLCASHSGRSERNFDSLLHPPLLIPRCPPIRASASTSHSHCPTAALIPGSQLNQTEWGLQAQTKTPWLHAGGTETNIWTEEEYKG